MACLVIEYVLNQWSLGHASKSDAIMALSLNHSSIIMSDVHSWKSSFTGFGSAGSNTSCKSRVPSLTRSLCRGLPVNIWKRNFHQLLNPDTKIKAEHQQDTFLIRSIEKAVSQRLLHLPVLLVLVDLH